MNETPSPEVSVIVCTRNGAETIAEALDSLVAQQTEVEWELIVVDNGSTDHTVSVVESHAGFPGRIRVVDASTKAGLGHARNVGVDAARGEFVAFCDDDDQVDPRWLDELARCVREHSFAGSRMEYRRLNDPGTLVGRTEAQSTELGTAFGYPVVNGAAAVSRDLWIRVGGNDESLTVSSEDHDFAIRVQRETDVVPVLAERAIYHYRLRTGFRSSFRQGRAYGYGHVQLFVRYGDAMTSQDWARCRHMWWWIATRAPIHLFTRRRSVWARQLGLRVGRLHGSFTHRCWCL